MDVLSPFISVLCHSGRLFHGESCWRLDVHPGRAWPSSPTTVRVINYIYLLTSYSRFPELDVAREGRQQRAGVINWQSVPRVKCASMVRQFTRQQLLAGHRARRAIIYADQRPRSWQLTVNNVSHIINDVTAPRAACTLPERATFTRTHGCPYGIHSASAPADRPYTISATCQT